MNITSRAPVRKDTREMAMGTPTAAPVLRIVRPVHVRGHYTWHCKKGSVISGSYLLSSFQVSEHNLLHAWTESREQIG